MTKVYIEDNKELEPQPGSQEIAMDVMVKLMIYGGAMGSGKSHLLPLKALISLYHPNSKVIFFRQTSGQIEQFFEKCRILMSPYLIKNGHTTKPMRLRFPGNVVWYFQYVMHEKDVELYRGLEFDIIIFDEAVQFSKKQITFLMSRNRNPGSTCPKFMLLACNPDPDNWLAALVDPYLEESGRPDRSKSGKIRYYITKGPDIILSDSKEELMEKYPELCRVYNSIEDKWITVEPKSYTFVAGNIFDNQILINQEPEYLQDLLSLPPVEQERNLYGNWKVRPVGTQLCTRDDFIKLDRVPPGVKARGWDKGYAAVTEVTTNPDFTTGVGMVKTNKGQFVVFGDHHSDNIDKKTQIPGIFRLNPGEREDVLLKQALHDGEAVTQVIPKDPAGGSVDYLLTANLLRSHGLLVQKDDAAARGKGKLQRFTPFAHALKDGVIYIVESTFHPKALAEFYRQLERFDGVTKSSDKDDLKKDDIADAIATVYNHLVQAKKSVGPMTIPDLTQLEQINGNNPFLS